MHPKLSWSNFISIYNLFVNAENPSCDPDRCKHCRECTETENGGFICNCTETFYRGKTCDCLLVIIDNIGIVDYEFLSSTAISIKSDPNADVIACRVNNDHCAISGIDIGTFGLMPCPFMLIDSGNLFCFILPPCLYCFNSFQ